MPFSDRSEAGRLLSRKLLQIPGLRESRPVVVAIPPGGVPVAFEIAQALDVPLDITIVRKLNGFGAISEDDFYWIDPSMRNIPGISVDGLETTLVREAEEIQREVQACRGGHAPLPVEGATVILVEDAIISGVAARAAAHVLHGRGAGRIILAAPVCAPSAAQALLGENVIESLVLIDSPDRLDSSQEWYADLPPLSYEEIRHALSESRRLHHLRGGPMKTSMKSTKSRPFQIASERGTLEGNLELPSQAKGIVLFAHGSGSSRLSPRNQAVSRELNRAGFATLLFDLLTAREAEDTDFVFDIGLLAKRLRLAITAVRSDPELARLPMGLFGASTGAAAALRAAAGDPLVRAVVSRGGRPDLTGPDARDVTAPVLLIVGGDDEPVVTLNQQMIEVIPHADLEIIPGATHLFEEPGALEKVAQLAADFFDLNLGSAAPMPGEIPKAA